MGHKTKAVEPRSGWLLLATVLLLLGGLGSSLYLGYLYLEIHRAGAGPVTSFCAISEGFNCVAVAKSEYAHFLGVPIALYGIEFFGLALIAVLFSVRRWWSVQQWESLIFDAMALGVPACGVLAWVSATCIHSFCIMCCLVYTVVGLLAAMLGLSNRRQLGELIMAGPRALWRAAKRGPTGAVLAVLLALGLSQFFWVPKLLAGAEEQHNLASSGRSAWQSLPSAGLVLGPADAPVTIEEFTDFECPFCGKAHEVMMNVIKRFPGKVRLVHRDFPLDMACNPIVRRPFHAQACQAAYYARCAARQNKYWAYEEHLFANQERLAERDLQQYARAEGLDIEPLRACAQSSSTRQAIRADLDEGTRRGIEGTPCFFINGEQVVGQRSYEYWVNKIESLLRAKR